MFDQLENQGAWAAVAAVVVLLLCWYLCRREGKPSFNLKAELTTRADDLQQSMREGYRGVSVRG
jgi:hypothetical protein